MATARRLLSAFGQFWWEFLIGENPDALLGTLVIVGVAIGLRHQRAIALPLIVVIGVGVLVASVHRSRQRS